MRSETSLRHEQTTAAIRAGTAEAQVASELKTLTHTNAAMTELAAKIEKLLTAAVDAGLSMKAHMESEGVHGLLNRRELPGLTLRNFDRDVRPWLLEFFAWKLGAQVTSSFKVFQADRPLAVVIAQDQARIDEEANNLKARAQRGW